MCTAKSLESVIKSDSCSRLSGTQKSDSAHLQRYIGGRNTTVARWLSGKQDQGIHTWAPVESLALEFGKTGEQVSALSYTEYCNRNTICTMGT